MIPPPVAPWPDVAMFALSFDGYAAYGSDICAALGNEAARRFDETGELPNFLAELRACLFFEQRRGHHTGNESVTAYISALVEAIRSQVPSVKR